MERGKHKIWSLIFKESLLSELERHTHAQQYFNSEYDNKYNTDLTKYNKEQERMSNFN